MSRGNYGYSSFKQNQRMNSASRKARVEFNREFDKMLSDSYDLYLDFAFNLYSEFFRGNSTEDSLFEKVYDSINTEAYEKSKEFIIEFINERDSDSNVDLECIKTITKEVSSIYYDFIVSHYLFLGHEYLSSCLKKGLENLREKDCVMTLMILDPNFVKISFHKISSLFNKVRESSEYVSDIFAEEVAPNLAYLLKNRIISNTIQMLHDLYEIVLDSSSLDMGDLDLSSYDEDNISYVEDKIDYIDDYRKLNKLASDNGFKYIRCKGDHGIFKNNNGLVVIPQGRSIGKGLSFKIQKAIYSLSSESA